MNIKRPLDLIRLRKVPDHFGWIDHRLRQRLTYLTQAEMLLLFFLHLAADQYGLSYFGDPRVCHFLDLGRDELVAARDGLIRKGFIAYRFPLYQLLEVPQRPLLSAADLETLRRRQP